MPVGRCMPDMSAQSDNARSMKRMSHIQLSRGAMFTGLFALIALLALAAALTT
jgi:hypothetical protein